MSTFPLHLHSFLDKWPDIAPADLVAELRRAADRIEAEAGIPAETWHFNEAQGALVCVVDRPMEQEREAA